MQDLGLHSVVKGFDQIDDFVCSSIFLKDNPKCFP